MINVNNFKPGITFEFNNDIYIVINAIHSKSARSQAHVKAKIKNLRTNNITQKTFIGGAKVSPAMIEKKVMQFLCDDGNNLLFMDNNTFDQIELPNDLFKWELNFLVPTLNVELVFYKYECLNLILPEKVKLEVTEAPDAVKGNTTSSAMKSAILETGLEILVPIFIKKYNKILINTSNGKYDSRVNT